MGALNEKSKIISQKIEMPPLRTYNDGKGIYSVDMMFTYLDTHNHPITTLSMEELRPQLDQQVWGNEPELWSPSTVLEKMELKKYASNAERIRKADLSYPIIVTGSATKQSIKHRIIDGYHRLAKAAFKGQTEMKVYVLDAALLRKFLLDGDQNFVRVFQEMSVADVLHLYVKRFC
jgi:hypothetical protein